ncbi:hypothetical protein [Microbacterium sp. zg-YB36]|uniref:hypothetical protein n=1 Tax=Microbacterium sp. zg-YB36 TaxID=2969407 RepID=UPI00214ACBBF|nr:hypothetical protein [Microbacterium sp. zg-YB36]MDL5351583.1 hypothetical protein [Microbacterium sp. zg-YB36]
MATKVTGPESITPDVQPEENVRYRDMGGTIVNVIGPNQLDGPRIAAREAQYGNRQAEIEAVMDIDQAAFDRVRPVEASMAARAEHLIDEVERKGSDTVPPGLLESTEGIVTQLNNLVTQLERGTPASQLAERFKQLQNQAITMALPKVVRALQMIEESHLPNMEDPYGRVQNKVIAKMPNSSFRPLRPRRP